MAPAPAPPLPPRPGKRHPIKLDRQPKLRLEILDLSSEGARSFLSLVEAGSALEDAVWGVLNLLYTDKCSVPPVRSVTLILKSFSGVAYTSGTELDDDHKEICFSTDYIEGVDHHRRAEEIRGVLIHEMVHCWQWAARGTCPGGFIEGIADWVRLRAGLAPPHWKREWIEKSWDEGYATTAYFLDYLEVRFGEGTIMSLNQRLCDLEYDEDDYWTYCCGYKIKRLWRDYGQFIEDQENPQIPPSLSLPDRSTTTGYEDSNAGPPPYSTGP
jgi:hypothetical protein